MVCLIYSIAALFSYSQFCFCSEWKSRRRRVPYIFIRFYGRCLSSLSTSLIARQIFSRFRVQTYTYIARRNFSDEKVYAKKKRCARRWSSYKACTSRSVYLIYLLLLFNCFMASLAHVKSLYDYRRNIKAPGRNTTFN